jgi:Spy/CpxP family protein refolding chaperone
MATGFLHLFQRPAVSVLCSSGIWWRVRETMQNSTLVKTFRRLFLASLALAMACPSLYAQDSTPAAKPSAAQVDITPEQRAKLKDAYQTAMQDPKVLAAQNTVKDAMDNFRSIAKKKVIADDPAMQPILDKADKSVENNPSTGALSALTPEERTKLHDAFQKVSSDPDVKAGLAKLNEAKKAMNTSIRAAILKADPSLTPVLDAIDKSRQQASAGAQ